MNIKSSKLKNMIQGITKKNILVINPGGSSTKIAIFQTDVKKFQYQKMNSIHLIPILNCTITHPYDELKKFKTIFDQLSYRKKKIMRTIQKYHFDAIATRSGPLKPLTSGTYQITSQVISDLKNGNYQSLHPSLLGPIIAYQLSQEHKVPAYFVDPESVDEFFPLARLSGLAEIPRKSLSHYLNINAVARKIANKLGKPLNQCNFIVAHLGSGITIAAKRKGKQIDANNANEEGPFSSQRSGSLPLQGIIEMCYSGNYTQQEMLDKIQRHGGLLSYLKTDNIPEIEQEIKKGNRFANLVYQTMIYQIAKEIGAMLVTLKGKIDAIIISGGMAKQKKLIRTLKNWLKFIKKPIIVIAEQEEMTTLAMGAVRVLYKLEKVKKY